MIEPTKYYTGPVRAIEPQYSFPYRIEEHCPSCGSTNIKSKENFKSPSGVQYAKGCECRDCGRLFVISFGDIGDKDARMDRRYRLKGRMVADEDREYGYGELDDAIWEEIMEHSSSSDSLGRLATDYYGDLYTDSMGETNADWEANLNMELDIPWAEKDFALKRYVNELNVGESYRMPDVDLEIVRSRNLLGGKYARRRQALKFWEGKR